MGDDVLPAAAGSAREQQLRRSREIAAHERRLERSARSNCRIERMQPRRPTRTSTRRSTKLARKPSPPSNSATASPAASATSIEPAIRPLGYDWKMGVGLVGAFAAREVFVSTMGIVYSVGDDEDEHRAARSGDAGRHATPTAEPVWTPLVAVSLLVWFVLAMQCMSTLAIVRRETGGWRWPIGCSCT